MRAKAKRQPAPIEMPLRPMARVVRVPLIEREVRERLSGPAIEILIGRAEVLAEGKRAASPSCADAFFGSVMMTIDLAATAAEVREPCDPATAGRVAELMAADARVLKRVRQLAEREAARLAGAPVEVHSADVRVRAEGARVLIDVDVGK